MALGVSSCPELIGLEIEEDMRRIVFPVDKNKRATARWGGGGR